MDRPEASLIPPNLSTIIRQFLCMTSIATLDWKNLIESTKSEEDQIQLLQQTILGPHASRYPVSEKYKRLFLKTLIARIEESGGTVADNLYELYADLVSSPLNMDTAFCYKTYKTPDNDVVLKESCQLLSSGTTGLVLWPAALSLGEWILENSSELMGRSFLELGCGVGFVGILINKTVAVKGYIFTDYHEKVLTSVYENLALNGIPCNGAKDTVNRMKMTLENHGDMDAVNEDEEIRGSPCSSTNLQDARQCDITNYRVNLCSDSVQMVECDRDIKQQKYAILSNGQFSHDDSVGHEIVNSQFSSVYEPVTKRVRVSVMKLDFASDIPEDEFRFIEDPDNVDIILASDVIFEPKIIAPFVRTLDKLLREASGAPLLMNLCPPENCGCMSSKWRMPRSKQRPGRIALIASTVRNGDTYQQFLKAIDKHGLTKAKLTSPKTEIFFYNRSARIELMSISV